MEKIVLAEFKIEGMDKILEEQGFIIREQERLRQSNKKLDKSNKDEAKQLVQNKFQLKKLGDEYKINEKLVRAQSTSLRDLGSALDRTVKTNNQAVASNKELRAIKKTLNNEIPEEADLIAELNLKIDENTKILADNADATEKRIGNIGRYQEGIEAALSKLGFFGQALQEVGKANNETSSGLGKAQGFWQGLRTSIVSATRAAAAFIATPIGLILSSLAAVGLVANEFLKYNDSIKESRILTEQITGTIGDLSDTIRNRASAINKFFGIELKENLEVARALVGGFGISYEEAFDVIEDGLIRGGQSSDEFLRSLREYPVFFSQAGFSVKEFTDLVNTGIDLGIYDDKLPDAIKEFSLSLNEQTQTQRDALENAFGKEFTDELFGNISNGAITIKDALGVVSEQALLSGLNIQQQAQLTADFFKGAGEDAGGALKIFEAVNIALNEQVSEYTELELAQRKLLDQTKELEIAKDEALKSDTLIALRSEFEGFWLWIRTNFYQAITGIGDAFNFVSDRSIALVAGIRFGFSKIPNFFTNIFSQVTTGVSSLVESSLLGFEAIRKAATLDFSGAKESFNEFRDASSNALSQISGSVSNSASNIVDSFSIAFDKTLEQLQLRRDAQVALQKQFDEEDKANKVIKEEEELIEGQVKREQELALQSELRTQDLESLTAFEQAQSALSLSETKSRAAGLISAQKALSLQEQQIRLANLNNQQQAFQSLSRVSKLFFGENKAASSALTLIDTYFAAQKAYTSQFLPVPTPDSPIRGAAAAVAAIASGLANVAQINKIKFEKGGSIDSGMLKGARHSKGGIPIEAEGGEYIFSRKTVQRLGTPMLDALNFGRSDIPLNTSGHFVDGGLVSRSISASTNTRQAVREFQSLIDTNVNNIRVVNEASDTVSVAQDEALIVENASF